MQDQVLIRQILVVLVEAVCVSCLLTPHSTFPILPYPHPLSSHANVIIGNSHCQRVCPVGSEVMLTGLFKCDITRGMGVVGRTLETMH